MAETISNKEEAAVPKVGFASDWLNTDPVFYHRRTGAVSRNVNDVIDFRNLQFDGEGLNNYLHFGYSVFGQTPVKDVFVLQPHSRLIRDQDGSLSEEKLTDPALSLLDQVRLSETDIIDLVRQKVQDWERSEKSGIIVPLSGGYDSRLLLDVMENPSKAFAFTYGLSDRQDVSYEVVYAREICRRLRVPWEMIELGSYHQYFDEWDRLFGISTHAHGMYHLEFYGKIWSGHPEPSRLLSGIIGDAWAGTINIPPIRSTEDLHYLGLSRDIRADVTQSRWQGSDHRLQAYFNAKAEVLQDPRMRVIETMRFKMILLCYLLRVPAQFGMKSWSPFLDPEVAIAMLNLPAERRKNRLWQTEYFRKRNLLVEESGLHSSKQNSLDIQGIERMQPAPLDPQLLGELVNPAYVEKINRDILRANGLGQVRNYLLSVPKLGGALRRAGIRNPRYPAYLSYLTLKPLEYLLKKRNQA